MVAKGREFLDRGDISSAVKYYGQAYDPDTIDEGEARSMLIEARSHLSRKHILEALECFEEALLMGTEVQRRQALEGIAAVGEIRSRLAALNADLDKGLKERLGARSPVEVGLALVSETENVILLPRAALDRLPAALAKSARLSRVPQHLSDFVPPFERPICIPYTDADDVRFILEVASALVAAPPQESAVS